MWPFALYFPNSSGYTILEKGWSTCLPNWAWSNIHPLPPFSRYYQLWVQGPRPPILILDHNNIIYLVYIDCHGLYIYIYTYIYIYIYIYAMYHLIPPLTHSQHMHWSNSFQKKVVC